MKVEDSLSVPGEYTIEKVPIGLLSDSVFTPDLPFRSTQTTIGHFLTKKTTLADNSYGVHKSEYSGTGVTNRVLGEFENVVSRGTKHVRTALHCVPQPPVGEKIVARRIKENRAFYAGRINDVGCNVSHLSTFFPSKRFPGPCPKQLFPRSIVYEIEYIKEQYHRAMMEALEKERREFEKLTRKNKGAKEEKEKPDWKEAIIQEAAVKGKQETAPEKEIKNENIHEDNILRERTGKTQAPCVSVCGLCGCVVSRGDETCTTCTKTNKQDCKIIETQEKWPLSTNKRQAEMMRVGYPFRTEAIRQYYQTVEASNAVTYFRPLKKKFPEKSLSSVNV